MLLDRYDTRSRLLYPLSATPDERNRIDKTVPTSFNVCATCVANTSPSIRHTRCQHQPFHSPCARHRHPAAKVRKSTPGTGLSHPSPPDATNRDFALEDLVYTRAVRSYQASSPPRDTATMVGVLQRRSATKATMTKDKAAATTATVVMEVAEWQSGDRGSSEGRRREEGEVGGMDRAACRWTTDAL
ncbi:hypothetical protein Vretifemale_19356 [Volvox reticuliferus]|uniref:Uncharacterized protein n=1 Tax=Volvox reticuliferus TaxID=1737510 RepID=A0A8J4CZA6_9CHLO|nr:hypothetical protein Vretifemale_19356 [Volvox reticuliferus]